MRHGRRAVEIVATAAGSLLLLLALLACKRSHEESPVEKAADEAQNAKETERANKVLQTLASLGAKVNSAGAPQKMKSSVLQHSASSGYTNFDVLLADELSDPNDSPKIRIVSKQRFAECASHVKEKRVFPSDCDTPYVVVLKSTTYQTAVVSSDGFTPGKIDATAYVFDMSNGEMIGGGYVHATTPSSITTKSSTAERDLNQRLGESALESLTEALDVKQI
jgi:hypothetical protein